MLRATIYAIALTLLALLASPALCSRAFITEQYDRYVRGNTVLAQPHDIYGRAVTPGGSVGVAIFPRDADNAVAVGGIDTEHRFLERRIVRARQQPRRNAELAARGFDRADEHTGHALGLHGIQLRSDGGAAIKRNYNAESGG